MSKQRISILLALSFSLSVFPSCQSAESTETTTADTASTETTADTLERSGVPAGVDLAGETISIWYTTGGGLNYTDIAGEQTGDVMDDAVYNLNLAVQERLNCTIEFFDSGTDQRYCDTEVSTLLLADDTTYDLYFVTQWNGGNLVVQGLYLNVADMDCFSFDKPWWDYDYMREMTIGEDKIYALVGDYALDRTRYLTCCYYNKQLYEDFYRDPDGLYQVVSDGEWTFDRLAEISAEVYSDLNGDDKLDRDDRIGATLCWNDEIMSFMYSSDVRITERDEDDVPHLVMNNEHTMDVVQALYTLAKSSVGIYFGNEPEDIEVQKNTQKFTEGTSMFMFGQFATADLLREMTDDYGVIPNPKFDAEQSDYHSTTYEAMRFMAVPYNCQKADAACMLLEELAFEGYNSILPVYYETVLKNKYVRDDVSARMIDLIRENLATDFAIIYGVGCGSLCYAHRDMIRNGKSDFASEYASKEAAAKAGLDELIEHFSAIE